MQSQLGDGKTAEITSIENIDLDEQVVLFEGQRLTEAGAEAIARDITARHGRTGGRPRLAEETSRLGLRLPRELHERLREAAHRAGLSESELAREAIDDFLARGA
ncbi:MAG: ribbon-helix-helix protein, CopG family [Micropruina sp.]|nr:ribbon-helix-helix protein, CopG family [Micropruina sp.]